MTPSGPIGPMLTFNHIPKLGALPLITMPTVNIIFKFKSGSRLLFSTNHKSVARMRTPILVSCRDWIFTNTVQYCTVAKKTVEKKTWARREGEEIEIY